MYKEIKHRNIQSIICKERVTKVIQYLNLTKNQPNLNIYDFTGKDPEVKTRSIM